MAHVGSFERNLRLSGVALLLVAPACGGDGSSTETSVGASTVTVTAAELEAALLSVEDLGDGWTTEGAEHLDLGSGGRREGRCPTGEAFTEPDAAVATDFENESGRFVAELLLTFPSPRDANEWATAFESCAGQEWEEGDDPVEHVSVEELTIDELGDDATAVLLLYAHGDDEPPAHDEGVALVRLGHALVVVSESGPDVVTPYDQTLLEDSAAIAVSKAQDSLGT